MTASHHTHLNAGLSPPLGSLGTFSAVPHPRGEVGRSERRDEVPNLIGWRAGLRRGRRRHGCARSGAHPAVPGQDDSIAHVTATGSARRRRPPRREPGSGDPAVTRATARCFEQRQVSNVAFGGLLFSHWTPRRWTRTKPSPARSRRRKTAPPPPRSSPRLETRRRGRTRAARRIRRPARVGGVDRAGFRGSRRARARAQRRARRQARGGGRCARCGVGGGGERARRRWGTTQAPVARGRRAAPRARWFKREFFVVRQARVQDVRVQTSGTMGEPTAESARTTRGGSRRRCPLCQAVTRFPRYNDARKLLETRTAVRGGPMRLLWFAARWGTTRGGVSIGPITCGRRWSVSQRRCSLRQLRGRLR